MINRWLLAALLIGCLALPCRADVIYFKNGSRVEVPAAKVDGDQVRCEIYGIVIGFSLDEVDRIEAGEIDFAEEEGETAAAPPVAAANATTAPSRREAQTATLPAGDMVPLKAISSSETATAIDASDLPRREPGDRPATAAADSTPGPNEATAGVETPASTAGDTEPVAVPEEKQGAEASESAARKTILGPIHREARELFLELLDFRCDAGFHEHGFAPGSRYGAWKNRLDALRADPAVASLNEDDIAAGDLLMLADIYRRGSGEETALSERIADAMRKALLP